MMSNPFIKKKYNCIYLRRKIKNVIDKRIRINNMISRQETVLKRDYDFDKEVKK